MAMGDSMLQSDRENTALSNIHTKRIRGCLFGLVHPFLLMNRTGYDRNPLPPQLVYNCVYAGATRSVTNRDMTK
jgi:hypothetical protein